MTRKRTLRAALSGLLVALVIGFQWQLFARFVAREIAWAYPAYFDQVATLARAYETCEHIETEGYLAGLRYGLGRSGASSALFPLQAALLCRAFGPSRQSALDLNFLYLAAFEVMLAATLLWLTERWSFAFLGLGLLLSTNSPFILMGGLADLRMDAAAASLMGVFLCLAVRSRTFAKRGGSLAVGAAACLLVGVRTLALVYVVGILGAFAGIALWHGRRGAAGSEAWRRRLAGLGTTVVVLAAVAIPLLSLKWQQIHDYYVVGHLTGPDKWLHPVGIHTLGDFILYYPRSFLETHTGPSFLWAAGGVLASSGLVSRLWPPRPVSGDWAPAFLFCGLAFGVPLAVLTADIAKSPVVAGVLVAPALWLVLLAAVRLLGIERNPGSMRLPEATADNTTAPAVVVPGSAPGSTPRERVLGGLAASVLVLGLVTQWRGFAREGPFANRRPDVATAKALHRAIGKASYAMGWTEPLITVDRLADSIVPSIATTEMYERRGILVKVRFGVFEAGPISEERALASVARSDFVVLTTSESGDDPLPFDASMRALHAKLVQACTQDHVVLSRFHFQGFEATAYVRAALRVEGGTGDSIGTGGIVLTGLAPVLRARPEVEVVGRVGPGSQVPPGVLASVTFPGNVTRPLPAVAVLTGATYLIRLEVPAEVREATSPIQVHVALDGTGAPLLLPERVRLSARGGGSGS